MMWPGIVRFKNSDELEIIHSQRCWDIFLRTISLDCQLILSDGVAYDITNTHTDNPSVTTVGKIVEVATTVELARKHMSAQAHCCVSKFNAPSIEAVIAALCQLDD